MYVCVLPKSYLESSYLSLDNKALKSYYQESLPLCELSEPEYSGANNDSSTQCEDEIPSSKKVQLFSKPANIYYVYHLYL